MHFPQSASHKMPNAVPGLPQEPIEIKFRRWTHREHNYAVTVINIRHFRGSHGLHTVVYVEGSLRGPKTLASWPATAFLQAFRPRGRKLRVKSRWERLGQDSI